VVDDYLTWAGRASTFDDAPFHAAMAVPLIWQGQVIGVLVATRSRREYPFSAHERHLAELLANQTTAFIQNARLFEQIQRRSVQLQTSIEVSRAASSIRDPEELLAASVDLIRRRFGLTYVGLFLVDETGEYAALRAGTGEAGRQMLAQGHRLSVNDDSTIGRCVGRGEALVGPNGGQSAVGRADPLPPETGFEMALPLIVRGQVIGAMTIQSEKGGAFTESDTAVLQIMADQLASAIENSRLFQVEQRRRRQATALQQASMALSSVRELEQVYEEALDQLARILPYDSASLFVYDQDSRVARAVAARGVSAEAMDEIVHGTAFNVAIDESPLFQEIVAHGRTIVLEDAQADERFLKLRGTAYIRGWAGLPMSVRDRVIGILAVDSRQVGAFDREAADQAATFAAQAGLAMENARLLQETQANLREITRLHRRYLQEQWEEFLAEEEAQQHAAYLFDQRRVRPLDDLWRPEIEMAVARGRTLALSAEDGVWGGDGKEARSALVVPLRLRDQIIGALDFFETDRDRRWSEDEVALVEEVAAQVALAVENARAYEELQRTAEQLREMDTLKSQFLANMSHELRTPLNSIIGFSRVILKGIDGPLTDLQRQDLTSIYNNGQHLLGLINDILDMSRIEAGKMELVFEPMELAPIIDGVMSTAVGLVKDKPVELIKDVADDLPVIRADSTRIRQIILNLLSNAAKFTEEGNITLRAWMEDGRVTISVSDTGIGIPEDQQEKIFQEFEQVDGSATRRASGTGLGLPISRHFVEMHGGRIWVESAEGRGATFTFTIPVHGPDRAADPELAALEIDPDRRLVLAIEDNAETVGFYRRYLAGHDYQVIGLADGAKAQHWVRELAPFAVLLDIVLPDVDGWEVLEDLKTSRETAHVPVIACSIVDEEARGLSMGAAAFLHKPILRDDLLQAMTLAAKLQSP
jgi:signal transduction histidine kinase/CheY-like chemotaxis protein